VGELALAFEELDVSYFDGLSLALSLDFTVLAGSTSKEESTTN